MIYTHTPNPSVDYYMELAGDPVRGVQRAVQANCLAGGKGLNVSLVLAALGIPSVATAFLGGFTGAFIRRELERCPAVKLRTVEIGEANRINVKLKGEGETHINAPGPWVSQGEEEQMQALFAALEPGDWLVVSGSLAGGMGPSFLEETARTVRQRGAKLALDVPRVGAGLLARCRPELIKPNEEELFALFDCAPGEADSAALACRLLDMGVGRVLLSKGSRGAEYYAPEGCWRVCHPAVEVVNTVGAGDSMLAAFLGWMDRGEDLSAALTWAAAAGMAAASSEGLPQREKIEGYLPLVTVEQGHREGEGLPQL